MSNELNPPLFLKIIGLGGFGLLSLGTLAWFVFALAGLVSQLLSIPPVLVLEKGYFYFLGISICLAVICVAIFIEAWLGKNLTKQMSKTLTRTAILGVMLLALLPQLVHFSVNRYANSHDYQKCGDATRLGFRSHKVVYTLDEYTCNKLAEDLRK
jgi:hypothetical protein